MWEDSVRQVSSGAESSYQQFFWKFTKKKIYSRTFVDEIIAGTVLVMGTTALPCGLNSIFTLVPPSTTFTLKEISTRSPGYSVVTALPPLVAVKMLVEPLVPCVRVTGALPGAEKTISIPVRSIADAWDGRLTENVIISIPRNGSVDIP
jgi:hypothetical protein